MAYLHQTDFFFIYISSALDKWNSVCTFTGIKLLKQTSTEKKGEILLLFNNILNLCQKLTWSLPGVILKTAEVEFYSFSLREEYSSPSSNCLFPLWPAARYSQMFSRVMVNVLSPTEQRLCSSEAVHKEYVLYISWITFKRLRTFSKYFFRHTV